MLNSRIGIALAAAIMSLGGMYRPWGNEPAPPIDHAAGWNEGHNRSRAGTRSNLRYFHKAVQMERSYRDELNGIEWGDRWTEYNVPMRRAERKGVPGVPRGHGDKRAIRF